jgi:predicted MFS family arabinose efflux permease
MVIPFLSIYMMEELQFTKAQIGWVLTIFGIGSLVGSWLGGKLTDRFGFYPIIMISMFATGFAFIALQWLRTFEAFSIGIFLIMVIADTFRPASFAAISTYSKPENKTRSVTLIRLAINLGFMFGPMLAGIIIVAHGYSELFWIDGITCIMAGSMIVILLKPSKVGNVLKDSDTLPTAETGPKLSPYKDFIYLKFLFVVFIVGCVFNQLFSTLPLFYKESLQYNEAFIGKIMFLNGLIIVVSEMPLVSYFEFKKTSKLVVIQWAILLMGLSFFVLPIAATIFIVIFSMVLITVGEMLAFPFSNALAMDKAPANQMGEYLALYTMAFSASHIVGPNLGVQLADKFGYNVCWMAMGIFCVIAVLLTEDLKKDIKVRDTKLVTP